LLTISCALIAASPAAAGTAFVTGTGQSKVLHYDAAPGETNGLSISLANGSISVFDYWSPVTAGAGCTQASGASCDSQGIASLVLSLGDQNDSLTTDVALPTTVDAGDGNDQIQPMGAAAATVDAGAGDDTIRLTTSASDSFNGGTGRDSIDYGNRSAAIAVSLDDVSNDGAAGENDNVHSDIEVINGGSGPNTLTGSAGNESLYGHSDVDTIDGGGGNDTINAGASPDCGNPDVVDGGDGNDDVTVGAVPAVAGGAGDDTIHIALVCDGTDIDGGPGDDWADLSTTADSLVVTLDGNANDGPRAGAMDMNVSTESVTGGYGDDVLIGDGGPNRIDGSYGGDLLDGGLGADVLTGGGGGFWVWGDAFDVVDYSSRSAPVHADLSGSPGDDGEAGEGDTIASDVAGIWGGSGNDILEGGANHDWFDGGAGADTISGGDGNDVVDYSLRTAPVTADLDGSPGNDGEAGEGDSIASDVESLVGGAGNDVLRGNAAGNSLWGLDGNDELEGGGEWDWVYGDAGDDKLLMRDNFTDKAFCGDGEDLLDRDAVDFVDDEDCETQTPVAEPPSKPPPPPTTSTSGTRPPQLPVARDVKPPTVTAAAVRRRLAAALKRGQPIRVKCDEPCRARVILRLSAKQARTLRLDRTTRRSIVVATGSHSAVDSGAYELLALFSPKYRAKLAKARRVTLQYSIVASDGSGNPATLAGSLTIRR
jgi:Ca2+-binding RTX toxin-like protein